jgi:hypothetical protein
MTCIPLMIFQNYCQICYDGFDGTILNMRGNYRLSQISFICELNCNTNPILLDHSFKRLDSTLRQTIVIPICLLLTTGQQPGPETGNVTMLKYFDV